jgi:hypothetical protein
MSTIPDLRFIPNPPHSRSGSRLQKPHGKHRPPESRRRSGTAPADPSETGDSDGAAVRNEGPEDEAQARRGGGAATASGGGEGRGYGGGGAPGRTTGCGREAVARRHIRTREGLPRGRKSRQGERWLGCSKKFLCFLRFHSGWPSS